MHPPGPDAPEPASDGASAPHETTQTSGDPAGAAPQLRQGEPSTVAADLGATRTYRPAGGETAPRGAEAAPPVVPGYEVLRVLGRGGMGAVYLARHLDLKRPIALKMILAGGHASDAERARLRAEAEAVARL